MKQDIDYPAGHSMDSTWFGVDKNGNVAQFDTGEDGALPIMYGRDYSIDDFLFNCTAYDTSRKLYELKISPEAIDNILSLCTAQSFGEETRYFEGFVVLKDGVEWQDLDIDRTNDYGFTILLSQAHRLYFIDSGYEENKAFEATIKNGKIEKGFRSTLHFYDFNEKSAAALLGFYYYEADYDLPYHKKVVPLYPLRAENLASNEKLVRLHHLDFNAPDDIYIEEHVSSRIYGSPPEGTTPEQLKEGYMQKTLGDGKKHLVALPTEHTLIETIDIWRCKHCNDEKKYYSDFIHYEIDTRTDYPKVVVLRSYPADSYRYQNRLRFRNIASYLNVPKVELYETFCVKCVRKNQTITESYINDRYAHCAYKLETEMSILCSQLILCTDSVVLRLINSRYKTSIADFSHLAWGTVTISGTEYPLLLLSEAAMANGANIDNTKARIADILARERNLPLKPRVKDI